MGLFVEGTFVKKDDVQHKYRDIDSYYFEDIGEDKEVISEDDECVFLSDYNVRIDQIEHDVNKIIKLLEDYKLSDAIGELRILAEKLY